MSVWLFSKDVRGVCCSRNRNDCLGAGKDFSVHFFLFLSTTKSLLIASSQRLKDGGFDTLITRYLTGLKYLKIIKI